MSLQTLPNELLVQIVKWVSRNPTCCSNAQDLAHLALCARQLNALTTPILYETLYIRRCLNCGDTLPLVLRSVFRDPTVGERVKCIVGQSRRRTARPLPIGIFSDQEKQACENKIRDLSLNTTYSIDLVQGFRSGAWDAWIAVLLLYLKNLEKINFEVFDDLPEYLPKALHHAAQLQHDGSLHIEGSLPKLETIILASQNPVGLNPLYFLAFVTPKSVKNAFVYTLDNEGQEVKTNGQVFQTESLTLQNSAIDGDPLVHLLKCFPKLKHFDYDRRKTLFDDNQVIPKKVGESIQHLTETLETLVINGKDSDKDVEDVDQYSIGPLTKFRKLRALKVPVRALLGHPEAAGNSENNKTTIGRYSLIGLLPSSIKELTLTQCKGKELRCIPELSINRNELPLLQCVRLDCIGTYPALVEEFQKVNELCRSVGILLLANL